jgi:ribonuclease Y
LVGLAVGAVAVLAAVKLFGLHKLTQAKAEAERIRSQAESEGENLKKQIELDARNEQAKRREAFEQETEQTRNELKEQERRLSKREDNLDRKMDALSTKENYLEDWESKLKSREAEAEQKKSEYDQLIAQYNEQLTSLKEQEKQELLRISGLSEEEARKEALKAVERESQHEAAQIIQRNQEQAEEKAKELARDITLQAIQRYASEHTADSTVSTINISSDDMKGRIIGREGRNIRAFEKATGVDVIVDDTPGVVVVSCFDPVRRATAAEALQRLLDDGRIHPGRIEETVEKVNEEMNERIVQYGKDACIEANIQGLHGRMSEMMGRLHYRMSYGQNILRHSIETAYLCQVIADELGLDGELARRCGFLHDIGKAMDHESEGPHPEIGADLAKKCNEGEAVINAIAGHHNDIPATTPYTAIVMAADAISGARPGARRETLEKYIKRLEQLEGIATSIEGVKQAYAIQAGREVRVIVDPEQITDDNCSYIARDIAKRVSDEMSFPGEIRVTVMREMRTVEYAR